LEKGDIQKAYRSIMDFMMSLRIYFEKNYSEYCVSGSIYYGYMDMTYFSFTPEALKEKKLKITIVFIHESVSFEIWFSGYNKSIQEKYWKYFKEKKLKKYHIPEDIKGMDSIVEYKIKEKADFNDLIKLTSKIEKETLSFIKDITAFFEKEK
jgi:hypothetical protein